ncbi:hypothetical protein IJ22_18350 [Paenibacillus naphthalenovorans]|uniref:Uncharacterized protein n=1 Tax=Paenibacillus naphthalenovorans TaxID=162209 RepID=A0A0U2UJU7_9BACL|nr:hypothetical protein IJ22_18350 [Paenibacillus naphthalenovorans]
MQLIMEAIRLIVVLGSQIILREIIRIVQEHGLIVISVRRKYLTMMNNDKKILLSG